MTKWQRYPVVIGALLGAVVLPALQMAVLYAFFSLASIRLFWMVGVGSSLLGAPGIVTPPFPLILREVQNALPIGLVLGALSGSTWVAWKAREERRLRLNTRWSVLVALVIAAWFFYWPFSRVISLKMSINFNPNSLNQLIPGPTFVPWQLRYALLSTATNPTLLWALALVLFGWTVSPRLKR